MKNAFFLDIIFCIILLPGMMFLFPVGEWIQWHPGFVVGYTAWLYGMWLLCRRVLGPLLRQGWRGIVTVGGVLFLIGVVTFLMTLTRVDFPDQSNEMGKMSMHIRAMWILLAAVVANGLPVGLLAAQIRDLNTRKEVDDAVTNAREALEARRAEAETGEEIQVKADYKTVHIPLSAIQYIEGRNNYACFHLDHRDDVVSQLPLKNVLEMMPEGTFIRIHRSYIVPAWRIEKRSGTQVQLMGLDAPLPVGRAYKDNLKNNG